MFRPLGKGLKPGSDCICFAGFCEVHDFDEWLEVAFEVESQRRTAGLWNVLKNIGGVCHWTVRHF